MTFADVLIRGGLLCGSAVLWSLLLLAGFVWHSHRAEKRQEQYDGLRHSIEPYDSRRHQ
jgi:hypothetical protein